MNSINRREFLTLGGAAITLAAAGSPALAEETKAASAKGESWADLPIRALLLSVPDRKDVDLFCNFVRETLPKEGVNTLVLRIEYSYQFQSHPELATDNAISKEDLKQIVRACKDAGVKLIPCMNLLAHQSDREIIFPLLKKYPQFDESPDYNPPHPWRDGGEFDFYTK